jgi:hypothetical protein
MTVNGFGILLTASNGTTVRRSDEVVVEPGSLILGSRSVKRVVEQLLRQPFDIFTRRYLDSFALSISKPAEMRW